MLARFVFVLSLAVATAAFAAGSSPLERLAWLEGKWVRSTSSAQVEEHWTAPAGGVLLGMGREVRNGKLVSFEFFRVESRDSGLVYLASPGGRPATPFRMVEQGERRVVFENAAHDFPQRILYWSDEPDTLNARIEGTRNGKPQGMEWRWTRARR